MTQEIVRELVDGVWVTRAVNQGGGGGSQPGVAFANGLVKDFDVGNLSGATALLIDPTAQPWETAKTYSVGNGSSAFPGFLGAYATPVDNENDVKFTAAYVASGATGLTEPVWPTDGTTTIDNGTLKFGDGTEWAGPWTALTALTGKLVADGYCFTSDGGGDSGVSEPDWGSTAPGETIADGDITWTNAGLGYVWSSETTLDLTAISDDHTALFQAFVVPTSPTPGDLVVFIAEGQTQWGTSGATEPEWDAVMPSDATYWSDGGIVWVEDTAAESLVLTGLVAPLAPTAVSFVNATVPGDNFNITLEDRANVDADFGPDAASETANGFDSQTSNFEISNGEAVLVAYVNNRWQPTVTGSS